MKKLLLAVAALLGLGAIAWAGHFTDILPPASATGCMPVSNGYDYNCSTDSGAPSMVLNAPATLLIQTTAQIALLTPGTTGQLLVVSNPQTFNTGTFGLCISSGIGKGAWVAVSSSAASGSPACK